jgi:hypothetical protein
VLVGSASFWEGIDVPGDALQCGDRQAALPAAERSAGGGARQAARSQGRNAFNDYFVAEAAVALKQGAGRLIRTETDRGLLVLCDPRMAGMNYGRRLGDAADEDVRVANEAEADGLAGNARRRARARLERSAHQTFHQACPPGLAALLAQGLLGKFFASTRWASSRSLSRPRRS